MEPTVFGPDTCDLFIAAREPALNQALSLIVPVRNVQSTLRDQVEQLLEVLPDLVARFEIVVVDDGSTDHTNEIAHDLSRQFPQIRLIRNRHACGQAECVRMGMEQAAGEVVVIRELSQGTASSVQHVSQHVSQLHPARPAPAPPEAAAHSRVPRPTLLNGRRSTFSAHLRNVALGE